MLTIAALTALVQFARPKSSGPLDFFRDHLGVDPKEFPFDSPTSAYPQFKRTRAEFVVEEWSREQFLGTNRQSVTLSFTSNQLDSITVFTSHKQRNDNLAAEFNRLSRLGNSNPTMHPSSWRDGSHTLSYEGLCNPVENIFARFRLTTDALDFRRTKALADNLAARLAGPPLFRFSPQGWGGGLTSLGMENQGGPATMISVEGPPTFETQLRSATPPATHQHEIVFTPKGVSPQTFVNPTKLIFSVTFTDRDRKQQKRIYETNPWNEWGQWGDKFEVREVHR